MPAWALVAVTKFLAKAPVVSDVTKHVRMIVLMADVVKDFGAAVQRRMAGAGERQRLFRPGNKAYRKGLDGPLEHLFICQELLRRAQADGTDITVVWVDLRKFYDMTGLPAIHKDISRVCSAIVKAGVFIKSKKYLTVQIGVEITICFVQTCIFVIKFGRLDF